MFIGAFPLIEEEYYQSYGRLITSPPSTYPKLTDIPQAYSSLAS